MNDTKKREAWLKELKELREELIKKQKQENIPSAYPKPEKSYQKSTPGIASKMYEKDKNQAAKIQILMLALLTFLFEVIFFVGSYFLFSK